MGSLLWIKSLSQLRAALPYEPYFLAFQLQAKEPISRIPVINKALGWIIHFAHNAKGHNFASLERMPQNLLHQLLVFSHAAPKDCCCSPGSKANHTEMGAKEQEVGPTVDRVYRVSLTALSLASPSICAFVPWLSPIGLLAHLKLRGPAPAIDLCLGLSDFKYNYVVYWYF